MNSSRRDFEWSLLTYGGKYFPIDPDNMLMEGHYSRCNYIELIPGIPVESGFYEIFKYDGYEEDCPN